MLGLLSLLIAYLLGAVPFGYLLVKMLKGGDVRASGSGNIGATNVLRTSGRGLGVATLVLDIAKGFIAVWIAAMMTDHSALWISLAALAVMAGHAFPIFLGFHGGKAVASFIGAFLFLTPLPLLAVLLLFVLVVGGDKIYFRRLHFGRCGVSLRRLDHPASRLGNCGRLVHRGRLRGLSS